MNLFDNICTRLYVFVKNDNGVTAIEYAIIAVAMSTLVLAVFKTGTFNAAITDAMKTVTANLGGGAATTPAVPKG